jgi:hypothetical protein
VSGLSGERERERFVRHRGLTLACGASEWRCTFRLLSQQAFSKPSPDIPVTA